MPKSIVWKIYNFKSVITCYQNRKTKSSWFQQIQENLSELNITVELLENITYLRKILRDETKDSKKNLNPKEGRRFQMKERKEPWKE